MFYEQPSHTTVFLFFNPQLNGFLLVGMMAWWSPTLALNILLSVRNSLERTSSAAVRYGPIWRPFRRYWIPSIISGVKYLESVRG